MSVWKGGCCFCWCCSWCPPRGVGGGGRWWPFCFPFFGRFQGRMQTDRQGGGKHMSSPEQLVRAAQYSNQLKPHHRMMTFVVIVIMLNNCQLFLLTSYTVQFDFSFSLLTPNYFQSPPYRVSKHTWPWFLLGGSNISCSISIFVANEWGTNEREGRQHHSSEWRDQKLVFLLSLSPFSLFSLSPSSSSCVRKSEDYEWECHTFQHFRSVSCESSLSHTQEMWHVFCLYFQTY